MGSSSQLQYEEVRGLCYQSGLFGSAKLSVYVYCIDGLLIDTAQPKARSALRSDIAELNIEQIVLTHHHEDHSGNADSLREMFDCPIYASAACIDLMIKPPPMSLIQQLIWGNRNAVNGITAIGDTISTSNYVFQVIPIPGHAADMIALYEPERQWLFSADLFINTYIGYFLESERIAQQIQSIKTILQLDFKAMFCSHNPQLNDPKRSLSRKLDFLELTFDRVQRLHEKGYSVKEIFKTLSMKENRLVRTFSGGQLSMINMVKSIVRDIENETL